MFNHDLKLKKLFTHQSYEGIEFLWVWIPPYNPRNISRFFSMFFFAFVLLLLPFHTRKIGKPSAILLSSMSIFPLPSVLALKRWLKIDRFVFEVRDLWPLTPILLRGISKKNPLILLIGWLERKAYRSADAIFCLFAEAADYINGISQQPEKFHWIPNGIQRSFIEEQPTNPVWLSVINPDDKPVVVYAGTLGFANALDPFFEVIADNSDIAKEFFFLIIGDGYLKKQYERQVAHCSNVHFTGKVLKDKVPAVLSQADLCFISWHHSELYRYGVSANKYFDYMAAGKPILSAQKGILDPVVKSGCGIVVDNDTQAIEKGLQKFAQMTTVERAELGKLGKTYVANHHVYEDLSETFIRILKGRN